MIVDVWMQHPTLRFVELPMLDTLRRWTRDRRPTEELPVEATVKAMREGGVTLGLTSAWCGPPGGPAGWHISNDEAAAFANQSGGLLKPVASADISRPMEAVRELRRAVKELGCVALRIVPWLWNLPPDDRRYYPLYAECVELGIPFCTQVGHTGPLCPSEPGRPIPYLENVALEFPELVIVGGHVGAPWFGEMVSLMTKFPNIYVDTSAYTANRYPGDLVDFMKGRGKTRVMFGTNYPMLTPERCLRDLGALGLDEETRALFLGGNAARVFKLGQA